MDGIGGAVVGAYLLMGGLVLALGTAVVYGTIRLLKRWMK